MSSFTVISAPGHSCWTQIRDRRGWMVFIYRVMADVFEVLLWKWIHVLFCSHCWVQWDCLQIPRSVITLDLVLESGIRLDTTLIHNCSRKKTCSWFFTDFHGLWVSGRKAKTGLLYTGFAINVSIFWQNITLFKGLKEKIKVCCGVFLEKTLIASLSHLVLYLPWNTVDVD